MLIFLIFLLFLRFYFSSFYILLSISKLVYTFCNIYDFYIFNICLFLFFWLLYTFKLYFITITKTLFKLNYDFQKYMFLLILKLII